VAGALSFIHGVANKKKTVQSPWSKGKGKDQPFGARKRGVTKGGRGLRKGNKRGLAVRGGKSGNVGAQWEKGSAAGISGDF